MRAVASPLIVAALAALVLTTQASAVLYDIDDTATNDTQADWIAANLNGVNDVTFTAAGGSVLSQRNRGAGNTNGAGGDVTNNNMWRDFVFADDRVSSGATGGVVGVSGMDINVANLANKGLYNVRVWAFDDSSNGGVNMTWNGNPLGFPSTPDPSSLTDYVVSFQAQADSAGNLVLEGRSASPITGCCNVFANGFDLVQVPLEYKIDIDSTRLSGADTSGPLATETGFVSLDATNPANSNGASVTTQGVTFSLGSADGSRIRVGAGNTPDPNPLTADFAFDDGAGQAVILFFGGAGDLAAGLWEVEVYAHDEGAAVGDLIVGLRRNNAETIIGSNFLSNATDPITTFQFESDGIGAYDVFVRENNASNRARLNAVVLRQVLPVPEPGTAILALLGMAGMGLRRRRTAA